jgi:hypothetical protein
MSQVRKRSRRIAGALIRNAGRTSANTAKKSLCDAWSSVRLFTGNFLRFSFSVGDRRNIKNFVVAIVLLAAPCARGATLDDVLFLTRVEAYETIFDTTLTTQEGKRVPIGKGTKLNVAGFTGREAFIISRTDRPNGFVPKQDIAPARGSENRGNGTIREQTLETDRQLQQP